MQRRKILYIITRSHFGGAQKYVYDLATELRKSKTGVFKTMVAAGEDGMLMDKLTSVGINTVRLRFARRRINIWREIRLFFELLNLYRDEQPDIVHVNSSKIGGTGALAGRIYNLLPGPFRNDGRTRGIKIVFTAHGWAFKEKRGYLQTLVIRLLSWLTVLFSHTVITVSEDDRQKARWMPFVGRKIRRVHLGIEPPRFLPAEQARGRLVDTHIRRNVPVDIHDPDVVWIGTVAELHNHNKALDVAIEGIRQLREAKDIPPFLYIIIGSGHDRDALENQIIATELEQTVFLAGYVDDASTYLHAFDIFLLPSRKEGLPYTLIEAGYAGNAVIATNVGGIPEIIDDAGCLIPPDNPDAAAKALEDLIKNPKKREAYGKRLKRHVRKTFDRAKMIEKTVACYRSLSETQTRHEAIPKRR